VSAAAALGIELAIASEETPPLGFEDRFVLVDCADVERSARKIADLASRSPIDAIVAADDAGVAMAARASELVGLPHSPPAAVASTLDKLAMRQALGAFEVRQPTFETVTAEQPSEEVTAVARSFGGPVVIKPVGLSASRGVIRVDDPEAAPAVVRRVVGIQEAHGVDRSSPILIERFVGGREIAVEASLWNGGLDVLAMFDKPEPLDGPYFEETIYVTPGGLGHEEAIIDSVTRATRALGLTHGPVHAEVRLEDGVPHVIEVAARSIGGLCGRAIRFGLMCISLEAAILRRALGDSAPLRRQPRPSGVLMVPIPRQGRLIRFDGVEDTLAIDGVTSFEPAMTAGENVVPPPDDGRYLGFVFAVGSTTQEVERSLRRAKETLRPIIDAGPDSGAR
jgi:biotin carboxylase